RSSRNCRTSRRSWASSVRSSTVSGSALGGRVAAHQPRKVGSDTPNSRAICARLALLVRITRMASALNSGLYRTRRRRDIGDSFAHCALRKVSTETDQLQEFLFRGFVVSCRRKRQLSDLDAGEQLH